MEGDPEFWASVVGLAGAFVIVAALEASQGASANLQAPKWVGRIELFVVLLPGIIAVTALGALADRKSAPDGTPVVIVGYLTLAVEILMLGALHGYSRHASPPGDDERRTDRKS